MSILAIASTSSPASGLDKQGYRYRQAIAGFLLSFLLGGCALESPSTPNRSTANSTAKPSVVSTSTILTDLTAQIAEDEIQLTGILEPGADPHVYEPVPADSRELEKADLILYNGYNLEPSLIKLMNAAGGGARKVAVGEVVKPLQLQKGERETVPDPHVWGSVKNVIQMVAAIRDALIELSPDDRDRFTQNATQLTTQLQELDAWIAQQIQTIPPEKRRLVTTHDAFQYYARTYDLDIIGTLIGISTEEQPSAQTVQRLVEAVKSAQVPAIFAETTINSALIKTVAQEAGVQLAPRSLYSDSIGAPGSDGDSYINMMVINTRTIVEALGGKVTPFQPSRPSQSTPQK
ncbi:MAG: metal ABC transporter substrate-binding protein [Trichocoleus desertorum ATA4-8-CV12]|nr:metal ABC transporter substrate-binding protein [Trichocoleus desertorum ATA4-8-CV12]